MQSSHPAWGAWIEISNRFKFGNEYDASHPAWGAWIEIEHWTAKACIAASHPAWGAWIEISLPPYLWQIYIVAPRMGCVD